jgi:hypothetical protein
MSELHADAETHAMAAWLEISALAGLLLEIGQYDLVPTDVMSKERLRALHNILSNASDQLSSALRRLDHPDHYAKGCFKCHGKGMSPKCPECLQELKE